MAPGGSDYQAIGDSRSAYADYGIAPESAEFKNSPFRKVAAVIGGRMERDLIVLFMSYLNACLYESNVSNANLRKNKN
uniref:Uncharacterized protein n=1 Tax=Solanum tuberosum TaxID=4113 RepID=M1CF35_SOLTU